MKFGAHAGVKFYAIISGQCWLSVEDVDRPVQLIAGDCLLLPRGRPFRVASDLSVPPADFNALASQADDEVMSLNGESGFFSIGGYFTLTGDNASMLLDLLPPIVHIREEHGKAVLRWCLENLRLELRNPQPGSSLVAQQLASLMLVHALRLHLSQNPTGGAGWLFALSDKQMSKAIRAMHADPSHRWTLQSLASHVGMSRTAFALTFKDKVGVSVMDYLTRWRMLLAKERLEKGDDSLVLIAQTLGYESESSFCTAFKRVVGVSPRKYSRGARVRCIST